jgi:tetratricopeptide (TPR) repeat protein
MSVQANPTSFGDQPIVNDMEMRIAKLFDEMADNPQNELYLKHQIMLCSHLTQEHDRTFSFAYDLLEKDTTGIHKADCYLVLARVHNDKKEIDKAIEYYRKTIAVDPKFAEAISELASMYEDKNDFDTALEVYKLFDAEGFEDMQVHKYRNQGFCYFNKKEFDIALENFQKALELLGDEKDENLINNIGGCYFNRNNFPEAFNCFRKSLEINPQSAVAHYGIGLCYQHTDDAYRALHHYFEAIKIKPDYTEAYNNIAAVTVNEEGDYKKAIEMFNTAIANSTNEESLTIIYANLARVYRTLKEFDLADYYHAQLMNSLGFGGLFDFLREDDEEE